MKKATGHFLACAILSVALEFTSYHYAAVLMLMCCFFIYVGSVLIDHAKGEQK